MTNTNTPESGQSRNAGETIKQEARTASEDMKNRAREVADTVTTEAEGYVDRAKGTAADEVKGVASALRTAAQELRSGSPQERTFSQIAESLADASEAMRDKDLGEMVGTLNGFARRNPLIFLGSAALVGFAVTRFAKASHDAQTGSSSYPATNAHQAAQPSAGTRDYAGTYRPQDAPAGVTTPGGQR